jgi:hypothetical protein
MSFLEEMPMDKAMIGTIISVLLGGGLLGFVQFLISRSDLRHDKMNDVLEAIRQLKTELKELRDDTERQGAVLARTHILRFSDELYNEVKHSKEYFDQTLDDIRTYEDYCKHNEDFANGRTEVAAKYIKAEYERLMKEHKL